MSQIEFSPQGPGPDPRELVLVDLPEVSVAIRFEDPPIAQVTAADRDAIASRPYPPAASEASAVPAADMLEWFDTNKLPIEPANPANDYGLAA